MVNFFLMGFEQREWSPMSEVGSPKFGVGSRSAAEIPSSDSEDRSRRPETEVWG